MKHNKTVFLCGDINIDLLKYGSDNNTTHYVDTMFSLGLYPLIDKPTRITAHSSTLIDNIFTNELNYNINSGILINDISDHTEQGPSTRNVLNATNSSRQRSGGALAGRSAERAEMTTAATSPTV